MLINSYVTMLILVQITILLLIHTWFLNSPTGQYRCCMLLFKF